MKYAISNLKTESPEYKAKRYSTFEEAESVYLAIPEEERKDFGIAEILTDTEIEAQAQRIQDEEKERNRIIEEEALRVATLAKKETETTVIGLGTGEIVVEGQIYYLK